MCQVGNRSFDWGEEQKAVGAAWGGTVDRVRAEGRCARFAEQSGKSSVEWSGGAEGRAAAERGRGSEGDSEDRIGDS